jgi:hypothetical protein
MHSQLLSKLFDYLRSFTGPALKDLENMQSQGQMPLYEFLTKQIEVLVQMQDTKSQLRIGANRQATTPTQGTSAAVLKGEYKPKRASNETGAYVSTPVEYKALPKEKFNRIVTAEDLYGYEENKRQRWVSYTATAALCPVCQTRNQQSHSLACYIGRACTKCNLFGHPSHTCHQQMESGSTEKAAKA